MNAQSPLPCPTDTSPHDVPSPSAIRAIPAALFECLFVSALVLLATAPPAYAYVDPSVMTYTIQAFAGVAVALSAVAGVALRKTRRKLMQLFHIDENARKTIEPDVHRVVPGEAHTAPTVSKAQEQACKGKTSRRATNARRGPVQEHDAQQRPLRWGTRFLLLLVSSLFASLTLFEGKTSRRATNARRGPVQEHDAQQRPLRWGTRFLLLLVSSLFASLTLFAVASLETVAANESSLIFGFEAVVGPVLAFSCALGIIIACALSVLRGKSFDGALGLVTAFGVACYIQAMILNRGLPAADGSHLALGEHLPAVVASTAVWIGLLVGSFGVACYIQAMILNRGLPAADGSHLALGEHLPAVVASTAVWIGLLVGSFLFARRKPALMRATGCLLAVALAFVQAVGVAGLAVESHARQQNESAYYCSEDALFELSPKHNVVVFVLDTYDIDYFDQVLAESPEYAAPFEDFVYFHNTSGSLIPTAYAVPYLLTDTLPSPEESFASYREHRYQRGTLLHTISQAGYDIGVYSDSMGLDFEPAAAPRIAAETINVLPARSLYFNTAQAVCSLAKCALYRDAPWLLKPLFWYYTDELNNAMAKGDPSNPDAHIAYRIDDASFMTSLNATGVSLAASAPTGPSGSAGSFRFIHLLGAHYPYTLDESGAYVGEDKATLDTQLRGSLTIVRSYLDEMKRLGIYDTATIIVTADHGKWYLTDKDIEKPSCPLLLAKPARTPKDAQQIASGDLARLPMAVSEVPASHMDIPATIYEAIGVPAFANGGPSANGTSVFALTDAPRERAYYETLSDGSHNFAIREFSISGHALDFSTWDLTGREWAIE